MGQRLLNMRTWRSGEIFCATLVRLEAPYTDSSVRRPSCTVLGSRGVVCSFEQAGVVFENLHRCIGWEGISTTMHEWFLRICTDALEREGISATMQECFFANLYRCIRMGRDFHDDARVFLGRLCT